MQRACIAQDREHRVGDVGRVFRVQVLEAAGAGDLAMHEQDVAQHGEQVGLQRADDAAVDERLFRRIDQLQLHPCARGAAR